MTKTNPTLKQMTIYDWFSYNKKLLFWMLFILMTTIMLPLIIGLFISTVYPENKELLSFYKESVNLMFTIEYYLMTGVSVMYFNDLHNIPIVLNPIIASIIGFVLFKTCFFEKKLITIQKIIIVQYSTILYFTLLYFNHVITMALMYALYGGR